MNVKKCVEIEISKKIIIKVLNLKLKIKNPKERSNILKRSLKNVHSINDGKHRDKWSSKKRPGRQRITSKYDDKINLSIASRKKYFTEKNCIQFSSIKQYCSQKNTGM